MGFFPSCYFVAMYCIHHPPLLPLHPSIIFINYLTPPSPSSVPAVWLVPVLLRSRGVSLSIFFFCDLTNWLLVLVSGVAGYYAIIFYVCLGYSA
jgi:hypothetical protein